MDPKCSACSGASGEPIFDLNHALDHRCGRPEAGATIDSGNSTADSTTQSAYGVVAHGYQCREARKEQQEIGRMSVKVVGRNIIGFEEQASGYTGCPATQGWTLSRSNILEHHLNIGSFFIPAMCLNLYSARSYK